MKKTLWELLADFVQAAVEITDRILDALIPDLEDNSAPAYAWQSNYVQEPSGVIRRKE